MTMASPCCYETSIAMKLHFRVTSLETTNAVASVKISKELEKKKKKKTFKLIFCDPYSVSV